MIMWIYLFWWQMKLLLVTATLLRSCLEEPEAIDISKITPAVLHPPSDVKRELKAHNESRITPAVLQPPNDVQQQQRETDGSHPQIEQPDSQVHTEQVDTRVHDFDEEKNKLYNRIMQRERDIEEAIAASEQQEVHMANDEDNGIPNGVDTLEQQDSHQEHMPPPECDGDTPAPTATVETVKPKAVVATSAPRALSKEEKKDQAQTSSLTKLNAGSLTVPKARHDHERPSVGAQKPSTGDSTISSASPNPWNCDPEQIAVSHVRSTGIFPLTRFVGGSGFQQYGDQRRPQAKAIRCSFRLEAIDHRPCETTIIIIIGQSQCGKGHQLNASKAGQ